MTAPLDGLLVVDMAQFLSGPSAALRLGDLGARVIKVERPGAGDICRQLYLSDTEIGGDSTLFHAINRNKQSFAADLKDPRDLARVRGLSGAWAGNDIGGRLMAALADAKPLPADEMPARDDRKPGLGKEGALVADLLKLLLKIRAREIDVAPKLLARSDDLEALAAGRRDGLPILQGWRYDQFGHDALDLVEGRLGFAVMNGKLKMSRIEA